MNNQTKYIKKAEKSNIEMALTKAAYHTQRARWHLDQISTAKLAEEVQLTKQGLQARVKVYEKEVTNATS